MGKNVVIVMCRCQKNKSGFGIRFERFVPGSWTATWAFAMKEKTAQREGYDKSTISGQFLFPPEYPGCPGCGAKSVFQCSCGHMGCWNGESNVVTCPWCGGRGELSGTIESIDGGGDR